MCSNPVYFHFWLLGLVVGVFVISPTLFRVGQVLAQRAEDNLNLFFKWLED